MCFLRDYYYYYCVMIHSVPKFEASKYLVSNKEFVEFFVCGGYSNKELWTKEGWQWKTERQLNHPLFWVCDNGKIELCMLSVTYLSFF